MALSAQRIYSLHAVQVQQVAWQRVLESQHVTVLQGVATNSPLAELSNWMEQGVAFPNAVLVDVASAKGDLSAICEICGSCDPSVPVIVVLDGTDADMDEEAALALGAAAAIAPIDPQTLSATAIAGVRRILAVLGGFPLDHEAIVSSLIALKHELDGDPPEPDSEWDDIASQGLRQRRLVPEERPSDRRPEARDPDPDPDGDGHTKRRYRGQIY